MVTTDTSLPWGTHEAHINAVWLAREETVETLRARIDAMLSGFGPVVGDGDWDTTAGPQWAGTDEQKADLVRAGVTIDDSDQPRPDSGYSVYLSSGDEIILHAHVMAGSKFSGRRIIENMLMINIYSTPGMFTNAAAESVLATTIDAWNPAAAVLRNTDVAKESCRGGWFIPVGYRLWLSTTVGGITTAADGIEIERTSTGTLLRAPDDWTARQVTDAMVTTLHANDLDKVPKPN